MHTNALPSLSVRQAARRCCLRLHTRARHSALLTSDLSGSSKRIIEYCLPAAPGGRLAALPVSQFVREVAARSAAPGGGSVAALCAALVSQHVQHT